MNVADCVVNRLLQPIGVCAGAVYTREWLRIEKGNRDWR